MFGKRKAGKMLAMDRLDLEEKLKPFQDQIDRLNMMYTENGVKLNQAIEEGDTDKEEKLRKSQENISNMIDKAVAQYREAYDRIDQNSEITKNDATKHSVSVGTAVGVGTAAGSLALGALSLYQAVETDKLGLLQNKNVKRFFENINPLQILRNKH